MAGQRLTLALIALLLAAQVALATQTIARHDIDDTLTIPPPRQVASVLALGDDQFFFRHGVLEITHAGVADGDTIYLRDFDYDVLVAWLFLLDELDPRSGVVPFLAAYWYGRTPVVADAALIVDYLEARALADPETGWRWLVEAVYLARYRLDDPDRALELAQLAADGKIENAPFYVQHLPAFIQLDLGERDAALVLLRALLEENPDLPEDELNLLFFMIDRIERDGRDGMAEPGAASGETDGT